MIFGTRIHLYCFVITFMWDHINQKITKGGTENDCAAMHGFKSQIWKLQYRIISDPNIGFSGERRRFDSLEKEYGKDR